MTTAEPKTHDKAPADRTKTARVSKRERVRTTLLAYHGFAGQMVGRLNQNDGLIIAASGAPATEALMGGYDADPRVKHGLEWLTISGPWFLPLLLVYGGMTTEILRNHNANPMDLFKRVPPSDDAVGAQAFGPFAEAASAPPPPPHQPPLTALGSLPDEGLPHELEIQVREIARQSGRPYDEIRHEFMVQLAQAQMQSNGHVAAPATLGALPQE